MVVRYSKSKDMHQLVSKLVKEGWQFTAGAHNRITHPSGGYLMFSNSPSDKYAYKQLERDVRRFMQKLENKEMGND